MRFKWFALAALVVLPSWLPAESVEIKSPAGVTARVDPAGSTYEIVYQPMNWKFSGQIGLQAFPNISTHRGSDRIGEYSEISFLYADGFILTNSIRVYDAQPVVVFTTTSSKAAKMWSDDFPVFTTFPTLHHFSFRDANFAPPRFDLEKRGTPWLLFDDSANAALISPADDLLIASMSGDGVHEMRSGLNAQARNLPANFSHSTLIVFGKGIHATWQTWSGAFLAFQNAKRPDNEADTGLRYLGYWTDNGAHYYYNYDTNSTYAATLEKLVSRYRTEGIPIRYMQLDSWWYEKTFTAADGRKGTTKNARLPEGEWNRYGGLLAYHADPAVLPDGLKGFHDDIQLPLITHNRWVDPESPYHKKYKISGVAAVDPGYWDEIRSYIASSGVVCYEQDWLNEIYEFSPELQSMPGVADAFADNMARAARKNHLSLQYCMALPRFFLQGSHYPNLTTIRCSDDHFQRSRWDDFLFVSQLARATGTWPWTDVFMSTERNNLIMSVLSAGMVGVGDAIGHESKPNLSYVARADGVLVKPDESLLPVDDVYISEANGKTNPMVAWTYTDHGPLRTAYVFAYLRDRAHTEASFAPATFGMSGEVCVLNTWLGEFSAQDAATPVQIAYGPGGAAYYEVAPIGKSGIAFLGDEGKYVSNGRQRIADLTDAGGKLTATITFAVGEKAVALFGFAKHRPVASAQNGRVGTVNFDESTGRFSVDVMPAPEIIKWGDDSFQTATVSFSAK